MFIFTLSLVSVGLVILSVVLFCRSSWVFNRRSELNRFDGDVHVIMQYTGYDTMMMKFWIWDVEKFKLPKFCKRGLIMKQLFDVLAVDMGTHKVRVIGENKTEFESNKIVVMAVYRNGVNREFYTHATSGKYKNGSCWDESEELP